MDGCYNISSNPRFMLEWFQILVGMNFFMRLLSGPLKCLGNLRLTPNFRETICIALCISMSASSSAICVSASLPANLGSQMDAPREQLKKITCP